MIKLFSLCVLIQLSFTFVISTNNLSPPKPCNNGNGKCVFTHLCNNGKINKDGKGLINPRTDFDECGGIFYTCCSPIETLPLTKQPPGTNVVHPKCGFRNEGGVGFKLSTKTNESEFGEFPWTAALLRENPIQDQIQITYLCGGSLLTEKVILTASHCVDNIHINSLKVRLGDYDASTTTEYLPHAEYGVQEIVIHEKYNDGNLHNDIALLFLTEPVKLTAHINTICLPPQDYNFDGFRDCIVTGWGKDQYGREGQYVNVLKKLEPPIVQFDECQDKLRGTLLGVDFELGKSFMCAGDEQNDSCQGDGGGSLICPVAGHSGYYYQAGIVSWGIKCGTNVPGVYVNVANFRSWIDTQLESRNLIISRYNI